jgi:hypothetical protein
MVQSEAGLLHVITRLESNDWFSYSERSFSSFRHNTQCSCFNSPTSIRCEKKLYADYIVGVAFPRYIKLRERVALSWKVS